MASNLEMYANGLELAHDNGIELVQPGLNSQDFVYYNNMNGGLSPSSSVSSCWTDRSVKTTAGLRTTSSHSASHSQSRLLNWVAYTRHFALQVSEGHKGTCPIVGCEHAFDNEEAMLQHVRTCPALPKGLYRCFESGKVEKVGKCPTKGCEELKSRIARTYNSVKGRLSGRGSKPIQDVETSFESPVSPLGTFEIDGRLDVAEMPSQGIVFSGDMGTTVKSTQDGMNEEYSDFGLAELDTMDISTHWRSPSAFGQASVSELSTGIDDGSYARYYSQPKFVSTDLDAGENFYSLPTYSARREQLPVEQNESRCGLNVSDSSRSQLEPSDLSQGSGDAQVNSSVYQQDLNTRRPRPRKRTTFHPSYISSPLTQAADTRQMAQTLSTSNSNEKMLLDELEHSTNQASWETPHHYTGIPPRQNSGSSLNLSESQSIFSSMSDHNYSMSSFASSNTSLQASLPIPEDLFGIESDKMVDEPDEDLDCFPNSVADHSHVKPSGFSTRRVDRNGVSFDDSSQPSAFSLEDTTHLSSSSSSSRYADSNGVSMDDYLVPSLSTVGEDHQLDSRVWNACGDNRNAFSVDDEIDPSCYLSNLQSQDFRLVNESRAQKPSPVISPNAATIQLAETEAPCAPLRIAKSHPTRTAIARQVTCKYCMKKLSDTSNLPRHENNCKKGPYRTMVKGFKCPYPICKSAFKRHDNLLAHQRNQKHTGTYDLRGRFHPEILPPEMNNAVDDFHRETRVRRAEMFRELSP